MSSIFVTRIPKGLKRESVSRIIKQGIETVAQVLKVWVHPDKGYAFVDLYCESSINIVLELSEQIEINGVLLKLEIAKPIIRGRKQQTNKLQGQKRYTQQQGVSVGTEFCGYRSYTEYQKHRYETESGNIPLDVPVRKRNKLKPWKKVKTQPTMTSFQQRPTKKASICFQHCKKRNCHQTISTDFSHTQNPLRRRNIIKNRHQKDFNNSSVSTIKLAEKNVIPACNMDFHQEFNFLKQHRNSPPKSNDRSAEDHHLPLKPPSNEVGSPLQDTRVHVYNSSRYLFQIDVNNDNVFENIQTALCQNHICPAGSYMLSYNGKLLDKASRATIYDNSNIHVTVKGVGGMNKDDLTESNTAEYGRAQTVRSEMVLRQRVRRLSISTSEQTSSACSDTDYDKELEGELRIVLIGRTGHGKSATGNTILGTNTFSSYYGFESVTQNCQSGNTVRFGRKLLVVDTPGMYDTTISNEVTKREISKLVDMTIPGPHAIILVLSVGRFTAEEEDSVRQLADLFGEGMYNYTIVLFTGRDRLPQKSKTTLLEGLKKHAKLQTLLRKCNGNFIAFDNTKATLQKEDDVRELIAMIDQIVERNGGSCYTPNMYQKAVLKFKERTAQIRQERIKEIKTKKDKISQIWAKFNEKITKAEVKEIDNRLISTQNQLETLRREIPKTKKHMEKLKEKLRQDYDLLKDQMKMDESKLSDRGTADSLPPMKVIEMLRGHIQMLHEHVEQQQNEYQKHVEEYSYIHDSMYFMFETLQREFAMAEAETHGLVKSVDEFFTQFELLREELRITKNKLNEPMYQQYRREAEKKSSCTIL